LFVFIFIAIAITCSPGYCSPCFDSIERDEMLQRTDIMAQQTEALLVRILENIFHVINGQDLRQGRAGAHPAFL